MKQRDGALYYLLIPLVLCAGLRIIVFAFHGRDPALTLEGTSILVFPLTSISKRVERGEQVGIYDLFEGACATIKRLRAAEGGRAGDQ